MFNTNIKDIPEMYPAIIAKSKEIGFTMPSDLLVGSLLRTLVSSKPRANILELGTGIGLSLSWMIDGMDSFSKLITVDSDPELIKIAHSFFGEDSRVDIICKDGTTWIHEYQGVMFDFIFADAWPGKYSEIEEILNLVKTGGFYVIDDMNIQPNWPERHQHLVHRLIDYLEERNDFSVTKMEWSTGLIIAVKTK
ncbi:hypothetical protein GCM10022393_27220 [Aquimarina addita]|uniref:O-methyltransferase YrrM n=1 Tax=Aquimarina addita TaxID=870485 RepID=A0ABP6ULT3_9FLAO